MQLLTWRHLVSAENPLVSKNCQGTGSYEFEAKKLLDIYALLGTSSM